MSPSTHRATTLRGGGEKCASLALQLESELDEELSRGREVVDIEPRCLASKKALRPPWFSRAAST